jgi:MoaA/NifB/PqqE/SkfB family radical SAM enzyme
MRSSWLYNVSYFKNPERNVIKSVNQLVVRECHDRCRACRIWTLKRNPDELSVAGFRQLYGHPEFRHVEDLCISGGEPTVRADLREITDAILDYLPEIKMLFLASNAHEPQAVVDFVRTFVGRVPQVFAVVPLEGPPGVHKQMRGVDSYQNVVDVIQRVVALGIPGAKAMISTTLTKLNCTESVLYHVRDIALQFGCEYTFRPAGRSAVYYNNTQVRDLDLTPEQCDLLRLFIKTHKSTDPFMGELSKALVGSKTVMGDRENGITCKAGSVSVFIEDDGTIRPCIYSTRVIGNAQHGVTSHGYTLGDKEPCPCCTECQVYPMLTYGARVDINPSATPELRP